MAPLSRLGALLSSGIGLYRQSLIGTREFPGVGRMPVRRGGGIAWLDIIAVVTVTSPVLAVVIRLVWPQLKLVLDGKEYLDAAEHANYVRNLFELTSFVATTAVLITAVWAFTFTKNQIEEAKATRLASLYATLEARWASEEMAKSKIVFGTMLTAYREAIAKGPAGSVAEFADTYLTHLKNHKYPEYIRIMDMIDYLEYIGMLEFNGLIDIKGIDYLLGSIVIETWSIMSRHILTIRAAEKASNIAKRLGEAPDEYFCLSTLAEKFLKRYKTA